MTTATQITWPSMELVTLGRPAADALADQVQRIGAARVFVLASGALRSETTEIDKIERALGARHAGTWSGMSPHAPRKDVLSATLAARACRADLIVTVGGGSVTDAGKLIPLLLKHNVESVEEFEPFHISVDADGTLTAPSFVGPDIRVVCVPTTLSGGEFNTLTGATDEQTQHKQGYEHRGLAPVCVILDPALTVHTPAWLWLSTGVRAVDHAVETLASELSNYFCDGMAESAIKLLRDGLEAVKRDPNDMDARLKCQVGAWQAMIPIIGGVPMGASHAIGHILGGTCDVPHGYTSCVMSPYVLEWNAAYDDRRQAKISAALGCPGESAAIVLDRFIEGLGMPRRLRDVGVSESQLDQVADYTLKDIWGRTNPRPIRDPSDVMSILRKAY